MKYCIFLATLIIHIFVIPSFASETISAENQFKETLKKLAQNSEFQSRAFTEYRQFPFRRKPIELDGIIRTWSQHGSSIEYPDKGIVLISKNDQIINRKINSDKSITDKTMPASESPMANLLNSVIKGDLDTLEETFHFEYSSNDSALAVRLTPNSNEQRNSPKSITISLGEYGLQQIDIFFGPKRHIKIVPTNIPASETPLSNEDKLLYFGE